MGLTFKVSFQILHKHKCVDIASRFFTLYMTLINLLMNLFNKFEFVRNNYLLKIVLNPIHWLSTIQLHTVLFTKIKSTQNLSMTPIIREIFLLFQQFIIGG